jgi:Ca-activated chloride channel family protein
VILTDGEELDADGLAAANQAQSEGIRIFTVGIGSAEGSLIPIRMEDGRPDFVRDAQGRPVNSKLDDSRLREIAAATGGFYVPLGPEAAREVFQKGIVPMELAEAGVFKARQPIERFQWPLAAAAILLALSLLPGDRRRATKLAVLIFAFQPAAWAQSGLEDYRNGDFEKAAAAFDKDLSSQPDSRALQFNAGAAAYKLGDYEKAAGLFTEALLSEDPKLREESSYNLANTLVRKGEAAADSQAKKTNWESAIEHYDEALELDPDNTAAKSNRDLVKKLLEELEKQQQQEQQPKEQENQKQDQQEQEKQQQDQQQQQQQQEQEQEQDKQKEEEQKPGEQQKDQQEQQEQQQPDEQKKDQSNQSDSADQSEEQKSAKPRPAPTPTPGDKKKGELKSADGEQQPSPTPADNAQGTPSQGEEEIEGRMSPSQARALLNSLRSEEEKVNLMEIQESPEDVLRDW